MIIPKKHVAILVHGWDSSYEVDFWPFLKVFLIDNNFEIVETPLPDPEVPEIHSWTTTLKNTLSSINSSENYIWIFAHSIGCQTLLRTLKANPFKVSANFFIAPWFHLQNLESQEVEGIAKPWLEPITDLDTLRKLSPYWVGFFSDNDAFVDIDENVPEFAISLGLKAHILTGRNHFDDEKGELIIPELEQEILKIKSNLK